MNLMRDFGYHNKILHIYLDSKKYSVEKKEKEFFRKYPGGGLLGTYFLLTKTKANINPLSSKNILIFTNSVISGNLGPGLARFTICAKSPMTNGVGEARCEGRMSTALKSSGFDAIVIYGKSKKPINLLIENKRVRFVSASEIWGQTIGLTNDLIEKKYGKNVCSAVIGPAGENLVRYASVVSNRSNQAERMGMGAVMGSKKIKSLIIKEQNYNPKIYDAKLLRKITNFFNKKIKNNILSSWQKFLPGMAVWIHDHGLDAALNVENYRTSKFKYINNYEKKKWLPFYQGVNKCPGCSNDCIKIYNHDNKNLDKRSCGIHQQIMGSLGPNIGTKKPEELLFFNHLVNQYGLDPVSHGFVLSFAMELYENKIIGKKDTGGLELNFGNFKSSVEMTFNIINRKNIGNLLAEGTLRASKKIRKKSFKYAMQVKGLEMVPIEPRAQTNLALGYATSPVGPRHDICEHDWDYDTKVGWPHAMELSNTLGIYDRLPMEKLSLEKVRNFKELNNLWSGADGINFCIFAIAPTRVLSMPVMSELIHSITGWHTSSYEIMKWGAKRNNIMRLYNIREKISSNLDTLPDRFFKEPLKSSPKKGIQLNKKRFHSIIKTYYEMMGWDKKGKPRYSTLIENHLEEFKYILR